MKEPGVPSIQVNRPTPDGGNMHSLPMAVSQLLP